MINICFPLHCCSRYFLSLSKQRWGFAEPTRILGKRATMHGMWERFRIIGKSFEAASWMNYDLAEETFISCYLFWEDLLTRIGSISRIFGHNDRTPVIAEKWASLGEHSCCAQYRKVQIEPHTIDLLLPHESMDSHIMDMLSVFLSILEAVFFFLRRLNLMVSPLVMLHLHGGDAQSASSPQYMQTHRRLRLVYGPDLLPWSIIC